MSGALAHMAFLAFALLPIEYKNQSNFLCILYFSIY